MKNFRKIAFGAVVALLAFGASEFSTAKTVETKGGFATYHYGYNGSLNRYDLITGTPVPGNCFSTGQKCIVTLTTEDDAPATLSSSEGQDLPVYDSNTSTNARYF